MRGLVEQALLAGVHDHLSRRVEQAEVEILAKLAMIIWFLPCSGIVLKSSVCLSKTRSHASGSHWAGSWPVMSAIRT